MTDKEVDTSDIPPLDDNFFAAAQWRLPRLYIYLNDFRDARRFADYILKQRLHEKKTELKQLVHFAFNTSLIVSYSRPFTRNSNFKGQGKSSLRGHEHKVLNGKGEVEFHRRVLALRDQAYAHSAASSHLFEEIDCSKLAAIMRPRKKLDRPATANLKTITEKWIRYLEAEQSKLKESLKRQK